MRKKLFWLLGLLILAALVTGFTLLVGCGQSTQGSSSAVTGSLFYENASTTTPVFKPSATVGAVRALSGWSSGTPLYSVYFSLREFLSSRDEGVIDRSNLYKLIADVDTVLSGARVDLSTFAEKEITPPFNKLQKITCDSAGNDTANKYAIAKKETSSEVKAVISWIWTDSTTKEEYGIASVIFNKITNALSIDMTYSVDYDLSDTATDYNLRCNVSGNAATNEFQFKYIIGDNKIVAKGISRGADNYMLFKYQGGADPVKYIVVPSSADESFFSAQNASATDIYSDPASLPASVEAYKAWVVGTDFFGASDLASDISLLNSGNSKEGTIYIDY